MLPKLPERCSVCGRVMQESETEYTCPFCGRGEGKASS